MGKGSLGAPTGGWPIRVVPCPGSASGYSWGVGFRSQPGGIMSADEDTFTLYGLRAVVVVVAADRPMGED